MNKIIKLLFLTVATLFFACTNDVVEDIEIPGAEDCVVEDLGNGNIRVCGQFATPMMSDVDVETRVGGDDPSQKILTGWCMIFGEEDQYRNDQNTTPRFSLDSPLLQKVKLNINAQGQFIMIFKEYSEVAFVRFIVNLSPREEEHITDPTKTIAWQDIIDAGKVSADAVPTNDDVTEYNLTTFKDYVAQSVGLDGIYNIPGYSTKITGYTTETDEKTITATYDDINQTQPNPTNLATAFPMSSNGFPLKGINDDELKKWFNDEVHLVQVCSKVDITVTDPGFKIKEVYLVNGAQESRIRSTVLTTEGTDDTQVTKKFEIPVNLGGCIDYDPLIIDETFATGNTTDPIYFYPNSGGDYGESGVVDQDINPQYIVIKGRADGYDTDGYYKVALKSQYPLSADAMDHEKTDRNYWTPLTYDILRNFDFNINLKLVKKPGYKTLEDAKNDKNPANNISYDITIASEDCRHEILVSKGTYFVELDCSRIFMKGYGGAEVNSSITFTLNPNSENFTPNTYVMGDGGIEILSCEVDGSTIDVSDVPEDIKNDADFDANVSGKWVKIDAADKQIKVKVNFRATSHGNVRLRIGDILKFIPVEYDEKLVNHDASTESISIGSEKDFSYYEIEYLDANDDILTENTPNWFNKEGKVTKFAPAVNESDEPRELRAMLYPTANDGVTKVYFKQASTTPYYEETEDSNCYILNPSTDDEVNRTIYDIHIDRIDKVWGENTNFIQAKPENTLAEVNGNWEPVIIWHDCTAANTTLGKNTLTLDGGAVLKIEKVDGTDIVRVTLPSEFKDLKNHCNVLFAVRKTDESKTILWSWHLWITDYDPYPETKPAIQLGPCSTLVTSGALHRYGANIFNGYNDDNKTQKEIRLYDEKWMLDRNIGARSADASGYKNGSNYVGSLYYQFGRKDPFPVGTHVVYNEEYKYTVSSLDDGNKTEDGTLTTQGNTQLAVANPTKFYAHSSSWTTESGGSYNVAFDGWHGKDKADSDDTENVDHDYLKKTILDPSPKGFRVPNYKVWDTYTCDKENPKTEYVFESIKAFYPLNSAIYGETKSDPNKTRGKLITNVFNCYVWSAAPNDASHGIYLNITAKTGIITGQGTENASSSYGMGVRPIQE